MKLVVCFPGIGYHCDKPLLYYSRKLAACAGYDHTLLLQYTYHKDGLRGSPAALREAFDTLYAQAEAQRTIDEAFRNSGLSNPYTKKPITSKAEYDEYRTRLEADRKARLLKKSGMSDDEFREFVQGLPEVKQAKEAQAAAETAARQAREQQAKLKVEEQLKEISALDPSIQELKDLAKMETYPKFYELVKRGNTLTDAFKLANYEALTGRAAAARRQAALNSAQGKQHLSPTTQRGAGAVSVPADVKAEYLAFNPDATDAEIQQHYNRYVKNHKK